MKRLKSSLGACTCLLLIAMRHSRARADRLLLDADRESLTAEENRPDIKQREKALRTNLVKKVNTRLKAMTKYKASYYLSPLADAGSFFFCNVF